MGNTIRRQPITNSIPAAPDYQFLNVLNFEGLNMTDNPFTADVTTASDCLNVYVDEVGALTTRPRLELFYDLHNQHPGMTRLLGVYPLSIGYLFHYIENGSYALDIAYDVDNALTFVNVDTYEHGVNPKVDTLSVFEQNDKIYILSGEGYYFITYEIMDDTIIRAEIDVVDGYVPTARVGRNKLVYNKDDDTTTVDVEGAAYEPLNLLSDKYKETYFWDGTYNPLGESIENAYIDAMDFSTEDYYIIKHLNSKKANDTEINTFLVRDIRDGASRDAFGVLKIVNGIESEYKRISSPPNNLVNFPENYTPIIDMTNDESKVIVMYRGMGSHVANTRDLGGVYVGTKIGEHYEWQTIIEDTDTAFSSDTTFSISAYSAVAIADNKNILFHNKTRVYYGKYLEKDGSYKLLTYAIPDTINTRYGFKYSADLSVFGMLMSDNTNEGANIIDTFIVNDNTDALSPTEYKTNRSFGAGIAFSHDGTKFVMVEDDGTIKLYADYKGAKTKTILPFIENAVNNTCYNTELDFAFSSDDDKLYFWSVGESGSGYIYLPNNAVIDLGDALITPNPNTRYSNNTKPMASKNEIYLFSNSYGIYYVRRTRFKFDSIEPLLTITNTITSQDESYDDWTNKRDLFLKAVLSTRFNNERWFASGNRLYYTSYNDPTYIGSYNYNDLGESDESITGFNLADDSTLIVYKDNRVHSVRYGEVGEDVHTYIYSDSPNTVGNNAIGGSIVSVLTEMPLQISYDGIYALRQLQNVESSGRISQLISDKINKKWLNEDKEIIKNCKTINRLYWTYFVLSEKNISKIYLLDNRTGSWYYWELPISILNVFVKNNTTYFSDIEGNLYTLQTSDIINKYNPNKTEYYDYGEKLIEWYWKSQILPMKTINYSKKLISTTFIMSDTDENDQYGLNYKFKAFRKTASQTQETTLSNNINYIVSTTKRTLVPRYNFMQIELSNIEDDVNNNKLRLIGLAFKYVLLEGMI